MSELSSSIAVKPVLVAEELAKTFDVRDGLRRRRIRAVDRVSLSLAAGETLAVVGESGCGKSTLARMLVGLAAPTRGRVRLGRALTPIPPGRFRPREIQMVFQDSTRSLNPKMRVGESVREPLDVLNIGKSDERRRRAGELLHRVGLDASCAARFPHELSGGQRQRVGIARALATEPSVLVCDEPVSALDVSVQASILNLLRETCASLGTAILLITHDLAVVRQAADRVAVMYLGRIVESGSVDEVLGNPAHPYTRALIDAVPRVGVDRRAASAAKGEPPDPANPPSGCAFHPRCPIAVARCQTENPGLEALMGDVTGHRVACFEAHATITRPS